MSNVDAPFGLKPVRHMTGGAIRMEEYPIASGYGTSIFRGDPVLQTTDGSLIIAVGTAGTPSVQTFGVFWGVEYTDAAGEVVFSKYWPASTVATNIKAHVYADPDIVFAIQSDATGVAAGDVGQLCDVEIVAGDTKTGVSKTNLDMSTGSAATGKHLRIMRIINDGENEAGAYADVEVIFAEHAIKGVVSGVGGI
jgi:hypothetical protein